MTADTTYDIHFAFLYSLLTDDTTLTFTCPFLFVTADTTLTLTCPFLFVTADTLDLHLSFLVCDS